MQNVLIITDVNKDPDDLITLIMAAALHKRGKMNLLGVLTTSGDETATLNRAMYAKGILNSLNLNVPVCAGSGKQYKTDIERESMNLFVNTSEVRKYMGAGPDVERKPREFLTRIFEQAQDKNISLLCVAGLTDIARFVITDKRLFLDKIDKIAIMGGIYLSPSGKVKLDEAYNNMCDFSAAEVVRKFSVEQNIKTVVINRDAVRKVPVDFEFYRTMLAGEHPVGVHAYNIQFAAFESMIKSVQDGTNIKRHTIEWFFKTFTTIQTEDYKKFRNADPALIVNMIDRINLYDPLTLMALLEDEFAELFAYTQHEQIYLPSPKRTREIYEAFYSYTSEYLKNIHDLKNI